MKPSKLPALLALALAATADRGLAQSFSFAGNVPAGGIVIPDNNGSGVASVLTVAGLDKHLASLSIHLEIAGGFNGDLYGYVEHAGVLGVLVNRVGRSAVNPDGYADAGFDVELVPGVAGGDVHGYRATQDPLGGALTGTWQADGRAIDPASSVTTSPRTAGLGPMIGGDPNGDWVLFLADLAPGGEGKLVKWSIEGVAIPEPGEWTAMAAAALAGFAIWRRRGA